MTRKLYLWENNLGPIGERAERCHCFTTSSDYFAGVAFEEDFADKFSGWSRVISEMPGTVEGAC